MNLRIPGPTPLPPEVMQAVGQQMIRNRGALAFDARHGNTLHKSALGKEE